ncbi:MAG: anti-anti-sigma factor [Bacteroidetes bacterium]|nr:anti-anti-sigma factor [Fibrella sp.]
MNYSIEKNEQYALIRLNESDFDGEVAPTFDTLSRTLFREGYSNIIVDMDVTQTIDDDAITVVRKINRQCTSEDGLMIVVTKNEEIIDELDLSNIPDLTILPTVEEAVDAVFMNDLENDFRNEDDSQHDGGSGRESDY